MSHPIVRRITDARKQFRGLSTSFIILYCEFVAVEPAILIALCEFMLNVTQTQVIIYRTERVCPYEKTLGAGSHIVVEHSYSNWLWWWIYYSCSVDHIGECVLFANIDPDQWNINLHSYGDGNRSLQFRSRLVGNGWHNHIFGSIHTNIRWNSQNHGSINPGFRNIWLHINNDNKSNRSNNKHY